MKIFQSLLTYINLIKKIIMIKNNYTKKINVNIIHYFNYYLITNYFLFDH